MMEKRHSPSIKITVTICKIVQIFVTLLLLMYVIMIDLSLSVYVKKCIIVFIVNKLILIYFIYFVYNFVIYFCIYICYIYYKYNYLLKRNDVFLVPLSTFVTLVSIKGKISE